MWFTLWGYVPRWYLGLLADQGRAHTQLVLQWLLENRVWKTEKFFLEIDSVEYLGHIVVALSRSNWISSWGSHASIDIPAEASFSEVAAPTHHMNPTYIQEAKRLNPCQVCWALYFIRSNFTQYISKGRPSPVWYLKTKPLLHQTPPWPWSLKSSCAASKP